MAAGMERQAEAMYDLSNHFYKINTSAFTGLPELQGIRERAESVKYRNMNRATVAQTCCSQAGDTLTRAQEYYASTEHGSAAQVDATLPRHKHDVPFSVGDVAPIDAPNAPYTDLSDARGRLVEPPSYDEQLSWKPALESDLMKAGPAIRELIKCVLDEDPLEFKNAAWAYSDVAANIDDYIRRGQDDWTGNASSAAYDHLEKIVDGLRGEHDVNRYLCNQFIEVAEGSYEIFIFLSGEVSNWIDRCIQAGIAALAATGTVEIPGLNIFTAAHAAYRVYQAVEGGYEILSRTIRLKDMLVAFEASLSMSGDSSFETKTNGRMFPSGTFHTPA
ncbi:hypothetical protein [Amycolatopsis aidingensis]|uniref:hypothetical protein n=1 Tax=Amycolatopsis aidingensis TaxID=2842453 RepID=UPI001C0C8E53|nr:hypothetical protein [Amycolatopsis aidingensis]